MVTRCAGTTKAGIQCSKPTFGRGGLCFVHGALRIVRERGSGESGRESTWRDNLSASAAIAESSSKLIIVVAGASYFAGLLTTNFYLLRWGVVDFSVVKTKYVLTGGVFLFLSFCGFVPLFCLWSIVRDGVTQEYSLGERCALLIVKGCVSLGLVVGLWWMIAVYLLDHRYSLGSIFIVGEWEAIRRVLVLGIPWAYSHWCFTSGLPVWQRQRWRQPGVVVLFCLWTGSLVFFGNSLFPRINPQFGGARPLWARVLLEEDLAEVLPPGLATGGAVVEWTIVHERSDDYLFAVFDSERRSVNVFSVPRRLVKGVLVDEVHQYERRVEDVKEGAVFTAGRETWSMILSMADHDFSMADIARQTNLLETDVLNLLLVWRVLVDSVKKGAHVMEHERLVQSRPAEQNELIEYLYAEARRRSEPTDGR